MAEYNGNEWELINISNKKYNKRKLVYTGTTQVLKLNPGIYKLECWGAQGGTMESGWTGVGGYGGYACGTLTLTEATNIYINIGQQGQGYNSSRSVHYGGWNGGGYCYAGASGGGGATDIRIGSNSLYARVIVAGGGGGSNDHQNGGAGGGLSGGTGVNGSATNGEGGQQTRGGRGWLNGSFGQGAGSNNSYGDGGSGGGGWYGGGKANGYSVAGGGGSGYVYTQETAINYPEGCLLNEQYYLQDTQNIAGQNTGNGRMNITKLDEITDNDDLYMCLKAKDTVSYEYTGTNQTIILVPGLYKLECWGASGGIGNGNINPIGKGGYSTGNLVVRDSLILYTYVGQDGVSNSMTSTRWNGGGAAVGTSGHNGGAGGGATDFRITNGAWNDTVSLRSRILVAGGGGGAQPNCGGTATAGHGGGLIGGTSYNQSYQGRSATVAATRAYSTGGTQTSGGHGYNVNDGQNSRVGTGGFGYGVASVTCGAGGGGGWYGGGTGYTSGGGGGSSYAAGFPGCDTTYSSYQNNITLTEVQLLQAINTGNGKAKITYLGYNISTINCIAEPSSYSIDAINPQYSIITVPRTVIKNFLIYYFNVIQFQPDVVSLEKIDKYHYRLTIPAGADYDITINAIFDLPMRLNTDIFKDSNPQTIIEYESLLKLLEGDLNG